MSELGRLVTELQVHGVRVDPVKGNPGRRGGAGPSDHRALDLDGTTVMVPVYNDASAASPYKLASSGAALAIEGPEQQCSPEITTPREPAFYGLSTADGIAYRSIALLHSQDVLATTLLQTCRVSSARLNSQSRMGPWCAKRPSRWRKWRKRLSGWTGSSNW